MSSILTTILTIPSFLLFNALWILHSLRRPLFLVSLLCLLSNPSAFLRKAKLFYVSFLFLALSKDKKWKVPKDKDPASFFPEELGGSKFGNNDDSVTYKEKTVILIRHGESTWNDTFNAGDRPKALFVALFVPNLIYAIIMELYFLVSGKDSESWFFDSALSAKGVGQGEGLRKFLKKEKMRLGSSNNGRNGNNSTSLDGEERAVRLLLALGEESNPSSMVCSSNLRRAISTAAIGLADRFVATTNVQTKGGGGGGNNSNHKKDDILLIPALQEISRNPDALTILPPHGTCHPTWCDDDIVGLEGKFSKLIDTKFHTGNKDVNSNGLIRLEEFCGNVFDSTKLPKDTIIATGHSLFFRSLFQVYLPRGTEHISKKKKLVNGGTVMVTLREATMKKSGRKEYMIDPKSVVVVYGGFGKHTKG